MIPMAKMAAKAISELLSGASPACLQTTEQRLGQAKQEKEAWEKGMKLSIQFFCNKMT